MILESEVNAILTKQVLSEERGVAASKYGKVCFRGMLWTCFGNDSQECYFYWYLRLLAVQRSD